jgi:hypothetical protein
MGFPVGTLWYLGLRSLGRGERKRNVRFILQESLRGLVEIMWENTKKTRATYPIRDREKPRTRLGHVIASSGTIKREITVLVILGLAAIKAVSCVCRV